jgi:hypothetical protein
VLRSSDSAQLTLAYGPTTEGLERLTRLMRRMKRLQDMLLRYTQLHHADRADGGLQPRAPR